MVLAEADTWIAGNTASNLGYKERYWALETKVWCVIHAGNISISSHLPMDAC